jgi:hypothetical protein
MRRRNAMNYVNTPGYDAEFRSVRDEVSESEWQAHIELAAAYRPIAIARLNADRTASS